MDTWICTKCGRKWHGNEICPRCEVLSTTMPLRTTSKLVTPKGTTSGKFWEISDRYFFMFYNAYSTLAVYAYYHKIIGFNNQPAQQCDKYELPIKPLNFKEMQK